MRSPLILILLLYLIFDANLVLMLALLDGRIIGGFPANITNYPYQISLEIYGQHICGASIINSTWAVTAAHCVEGESLRSIMLRAGSTFRSQGGSLHIVRKITIHPKYNQYNVDYDVAVLKVSPRFNYSVSVQPISLATSLPAAGTQAVVTGWGLTTEGNYTSLATQLHQVKVPIIGFNQCDDAYSSIDGITPRMICAAAPGGGKDACQNDSGGPLMAQGQLVGIVSWGKGCGNSEYPGVYSNVAVLRSWIIDSTQDD